MKNQPEKNVLIVKQSKRLNGTLRVSYDYSNCETITDQAPASELTMATIVKKLEKGILPNMRPGEPLYSNQISGLSNLQDVFEMQKQVSSLYDQLPSEVKQKMGNSLDNFEQVIFNPENADLLMKHGLIVQEKDNHKELIHAINQIKPSADPKTPSPDEQK